MLTDQEILDAIAAAPSGWTSQATLLAIGRAVEQAVVGKRKDLARQLDAFRIRHWTHWSKADDDIVIEVLQALRAGPDGVTGTPQPATDDRAVFEELGRAMYAMTTTVHSPNIPFAEACAAIPGVWENYMREREAARGAPPIPEGCTPADAQMLRQANHVAMPEQTFEEFCAEQGATTREQALRFADELEAAIMEVANGKRKPGRLPMEPMVRLIAYVRTGKTSPAALGVTGTPKETP